MELLNKSTRCLPRPFFDETFTSWVFRCINSKGVVYFEREDLDVECQLHESFGKYLYEDPDFDFESNYVTKILKKLPISKDAISNFFKLRSSTELPWRSRKYYCRRCLENDIASGRMPYWRKDWCCMLSTSCGYHGTLLTESSLDPEIGMAWHAFVYSCRAADSDKSYCLGRAWQTEKAAFVRRLLAEKSRRWFLSSLPKGADDQSAHEGRRKCFMIFFHLFLQLRTISTTEGIARDIYTRRTSLERRFFGYPYAYELGAVDSDATQRMVALIWCGILFSIYSEEEIFLLRKMHAQAGSNFKLSWAHIVRCYFEELPASDYFWLRCKFAGLPLDSVRAVREFLSPLELQFRNHSHYSMHGWNSSNCWERWQFDPSSDGDIGGNADPAAEVRAEWRVIR